MLLKIRLTDDSILSEEMIAPWVGKPNRTQRAITAIRIGVDIQFSYE
jgi:hypothetical protein